MLFSLPFNPYFAYTKRWILSLSLSLYIYIYYFFWWMFNSLVWWIFMFNSTLGWYDLVIFLFFYLFNFIFFVCYMLSYEITEWFKVILLHNMTWIIWCLQLYFKKKYIYSSTHLLLYNLVICLTISSKKMWLFSLSLSLSLSH